MTFSRAANQEALPASLSQGLCCAGAASTRVSNELGAGCPLAAKKAALVASLLALCLMTGFAAMVFAGRWGIAAILTSDTEVQKAVAAVLPILALAIIGDGQNACLSGKSGQRQMSPCSQLQPPHSLLRAGRSTSMTCRRCARCGPSTSGSQHQRLCLLGAWLTICTDSWVRCGSGCGRPLVGHGCHCHPARRCSGNSGWQL